MKRDKRHVSWQPITKDIADRHKQMYTQSKNDEQTARSKLSALYCVWEREDAIRTIENSSKFSSRISHAFTSMW